MDAHHQPLSGRGTPESHEPWVTPSHTHTLTHAHTEKHRHTHRSFLFFQFNPRPSLLESPPHELILRFPPWWATLTAMTLFSDHLENLQNRREEKKTYLSVHLSTFCFSKFHLWLKNRRARALWFQPLVSCLFCTTIVCE